MNWWHLSPFAFVIGRGLLSRLTRLLFIDNPVRQLSATQLGIRAAQRAPLHRQIVLGGISAMHTPLCLLSTSSWRYPGASGPAYLWGPSFAVHAGLGNARGAMAPASDAGGGITSCNARNWRMNVSSTSDISILYHIKDAVTASNQEMAYQSLVRRHIASTTGFSRKPLMARSDSSCGEACGNGQWVASVRYMIHDIGSVTVARDLTRYIP